MSNLICPFCKKELEPIGTSGQFQCGTWGCDASFNFYATRDVWEYIDRTRKALDVAKEGLKEIQDKGEYVNPIELAESYLDEITALKQKD